MNNYYKVTKLSIREDAENGKTNEEIVKHNTEYAKKLSDLGFISGGMWAVETGDSYIGYLREVPSIGNPVLLSGGPGGEWFRSTPAIEVAETSPKTYHVKTKNSLYLVEPYDKR